MADLTKTVAIVFSGKDETSNTASQVADGFKGISASAAAAAAATENYGTKQGIAVEQLRQTQQQTARVQIETAKLTGDTELLARGQKLLTTEFAYTGTAEEKLLLQHGKLRAETDLLKAKNDELINSKEKLGKTADKTAVSIGEMRTVMQALAGSIVVREFLDANAAVEQFNKAMTLIGGSTDVAGESLEYVRRVANTLGIDVDTAGKSFVDLSAAAKGTSLEGQATRDIFEAIVGAMSKLGKSSADTEGALRAVQQMISKGTVSAEELRGQLGERLPGAFQTAARAVGVTTQELGDMLKSGDVIATEFLPKLAAELQKTFGKTSYVEGFNQELARLQNTFKALATTGFGADVFKDITDSLSGFTNMMKTTAVEVDVFVGYFKVLKAFLATGGEDTKGFADGIRDVGINAGIANSEINKSNESLSETSRLMRQSEEAAKSYGKLFIDEMSGTVQVAENSTAAIDNIQKSLSKLGIKPSQIKTPLAEILTAFEELISNPAVSGEEALAGMKKALADSRTFEDLQRIGGAWTKAFLEGNVAAKTFGEGVQALGEKNEKVGESMDKASGKVEYSGKTMKAAADEAKKAKEAAEKLALELEKLASNERIKLMEFKVKLDVARLEEDTKRIQAAFESINSTMDSTGDVISSALSLLKDFDSLDWSAIRVIESQLEKENEIRRENFELQKKLTMAQIDNMKAQTAALLKGDAIIKVDGAGLQPHLEAIMWELLKSIQVRVNRDGLPFLLGA